MFYRVDYSLAVLCSGLFLGLVFGKKISPANSQRTARGFYAIVAVLLVLRTGITVSSLLVSHSSVLSTAGGIVADLLSLLFGGIFGIAARSGHAREFLTDRTILDALTMILAFTFIIAGIGKALSFGPMTEFFTQSGYSTGFLKFIIMAEVVGGMSLLLSWAAIPALLGLTVDMFGAVLTHVHNGDPLNDSTGAIMLLIRLVIVGALLLLARKTDGAGRRVRNVLLCVSAAALSCLAIAIFGSTAMRHSGPATPIITAPK